MQTLRPGNAGDFPAILRIWEASVRASHHFLTEADIVAIRDEAVSALPGLTLTIAEEDGTPAGFTARQDGMVQALFIHPDHQGHGLGTLLLAAAQGALPPGEPLRLDVNEQNEAAVAFYQAKGFTCVGRSETDSAGRPFPLLHLVRQ